eukprot:3249166-Rhodomonas_salina.2
MSGSGQAYGSMRLCACFAMSGTEMAYGGVGLPRPCYAMSGTGIAFAFLSYPVLRQRWWWYQCLTQRTVLSSLSTGAKSLRCRASLSLGDVRLCYYRYAAIGSGIGHTATGAENRLCYDQGWDKGIKGDAGADVAYGAVGLGACYAMPGTDIAHDFICLGACSAMPGTDIAHWAARELVIPPK